MRFSAAINRAYERRRKRLADEADATVRLLSDNDVLKGVHKNVSTPFSNWAKGEIDVRKDLTATVKKGCCRSVGIFH